MSIRSVDMTSFRNHSKAHIEFGKGINVIWGENGSGKTSILEAVYLLSMGRSFRTNRLGELIRKDDSTARVVGFFDNNRELMSVSFGQAEDGRKQIKINDREAKGIRELIGQNPAVLLSPEEQNVTKGSSGDRRSYFDKLFSVVSRDYLRNLTAYTRILKQRNAALKSGLEGESLHAWDEPLVDSGVLIWEERKNLLSQFQKELEAVCGEYDNRSVRLKLDIKKIGKSDKAAFMAALKNVKQKDQILGRTTVGPHRDEIGFDFNGHALRVFGSQGEHKLGLVLIKLAEFNLIQKLTGKTPTLLLDDLFAKLDFQRSDAVLKLLNKKTQALVTNTDLVDIERHGINLEKDGNKSFYLERS